MASARASIDSMSRLFVGSSCNITNTLSPHDTHDFTSLLTSVLLYVARQLQWYYLYWPSNATKYYCIHSNARWGFFLKYGAYTGCPRRNVPDFGRAFLMLKYTDITQNTYVQSWTVTEIMAREVWNFDSCSHLLITKYILKLAGICGFCNVNICT